MPYFRCSTALCISIALHFLHRVDANLSSLCCGDNFCCAIIESTSKPICWGGNSMSSLVPTQSTVKALTCGGKTVMGIDTDMKISFYVGTNGYGPDHASASSLIGVAVKDADLSFWGGAVLRSDGTVTAWGPDTVYCSSATSISCQPTQTNPTAVSFSMTNVPSGATSFTGISCGGKRGGHWCCAYATGVVGLTCLGDSRGEYTPSATELNRLDFAVHQISAGVDFIAVLGTSGQLGVYGGAGEIGNGVSNTNPASLATLSMGSVVANEVYVQVSAMNFAIYALKTDGSLHAWGKSYSYSVGGGGSVDMAALVPSGVTFAQLYGGSAGVYAHYCALRSDGVPTCWGADYAGQVSGSPTSIVSTANSVPALLSLSGGTTSSTTLGTASSTTSGTASAGTGGGTTSSTTSGTTSSTTSGSASAGTGSADVSDFPRILMKSFLIGLAFAC